ncbi:TPM domain-containing protein [Halocynthiibacter sp. C4]|uniref:TPM domain-containing protein n=1 Tax=Halocynthiibacter sp. C4 TaxID=2992758 RepID=UPI00237BFD21|nr:TPM domain-containing protein [Halocynthiibacter sp. C4]MDE0589727.1 TPM domain-containing protein [Halocynthiibacter sp. C4]
MLSLPIFGFSASKSWIKHAVLTLAGIAILISIAVPAAAQQFPDWQSPYVNDYADLLPPEEEAEVEKLLKDYREESGVEIAVLTLTTMMDYGNWPEIEPFATGLLNQWGIGDPERNDGILILVAKDDRQMRIELGAGYPESYDYLASDVIHYYMTPDFKEGNFSKGILDGTQATIDQIAYPFNRGQEPPERQAPSGESNWPLILFFGIFAAFMGGGLLAPKISAMRFARKPCPQCGVAGMKRQRKTVQAATRSTTGRGETLVDCPHCGYHTSTPYVISTKSSSSSSSSGGFSGGSSSGGGASGRW